MEGIVPIIVGAVLLMVLAVLFIGLIGMARGGEFNRKYGNRLMRWRVVLQFAAVIILAIAIYVSRG